MTSKAKKIKRLKGRMRKVTELRASVKDDLLLAEEKRVPEAR